MWKHSYFHITYINEIINFIPSFNLHFISVFDVEHANFRQNHTSYCLCNNMFCFLNCTLVTKSIIHNSRETSIKAIRTQAIIDWLGLDNLAFFCEHTGLTQAIIDWLGLDNLDFFVARKLFNLNKIRVIFKIIGWNLPRIASIAAERNSKRGLLWYLSEDQV